MVLGGDTGGQLSSLPSLTVIAIFTLVVSGSFARSSNPSVCKTASKSSILAGPVISKVFCNWSKESVMPMLLTLVSTLSTHSLQTPVGVIVTCALSIISPSKSVS